MSAWIKIPRMIYVIDFAQTRVSPPGQVAQKSREGHAGSCDRSMKCRIVVRTSRDLKLAVCIIAAFRRT